MPRTKCSVSSSILALSLLPALANSYDCNKLVNAKKCDPSYQGSLSDYPECLVSQFGVSAFIQCASQESAPEFTDTGSDGDPETVSPLEVLTTAISRNPACDACPLANNIQNVVMNTSPSPDFQSFGPRLCTQIKPVDSGMCCLKKCMSDSPEHSIEAYCAGKVDDLTQAQELPDSCTSNRVASGDSSSSDSDSSDGADPSTADPSAGGDVSAVETLSPSSQPTQMSTTAGTSPALNDAAATSATSTSPTPQATGAASARQPNFVDLLKRLGLVAVLSILVVG